MSQDITKKTLTAVVSVGILGAGTMDDACAIAYSVSLNDISGLSVTPSTGTISIISNANTGTTSAAVGGSGTTNADGPGAGARDPLQSTAGPGPFAGENFYAPFFSGDNGARADAALDSSTVAINSAFARNIAEARKVLPGAAIGRATGTLTWDFTLSSDTVLTIAFTSDPKLQAETDSVGATAFARLVASANILLNSQTVYSFSPNGVIDAAGETADPFNLNQALLTSSPGVNVFDPGSGVFNANSGVLSAFDSAGNPITYTFALSLEDAANSSVPEPMSLLLLGPGLVAVGFSRSRRKG